MKKCTCCGAINEDSAAKCFHCGESEFKPVEEANVYDVPPVNFRRD